MKRTRALRMAAVMIAAVLPCTMALAQEPSHLPPAELERIVSRIALYPDPLLAQVLSAATFPDEISEAAQYADQHHYLSGDALANAINEDHLPWDPSVQALIPFPSVLEMMASDMTWTNQLSNAVLVERAEVMDAVQRERKKARDFGYLRSNPEVVVGGGPYITILPAREDFICVPYYDPLIVFVGPRPGFVVGGAINFGFGVTIGAAFRPWGWGAVRFDWGAHGWFVGARVWDRSWANRGAWHSPYEARRWEAPRRAESHELINRSPAEREAPRRGGKVVEEHRRGR